MRHRFFLSALVASLPAAHAQAAPVRVMVHALVSEDPSFGKEVTERMAARLSNLGREKIRVLLDSEVALMLRRMKDEIDLNLENCRKTEVCLAKLAAESESDYAFRGRVELLGGSFVGVLSRVDLKKKTPPLTESYAAATKEELKQAMFRIGAKMLGLEDKGPEVRTKLEEPISAANKKVALIPLTGLKEEPAVVGYLSESLAVELLKLEFSVMTEADQILLLRNAAERHKLTKPDEPLDDVIAEVASGMGADYLIAGIVEKIERGHFVTVLKLIDVQQATVLSRASESYRGPISHLALSLKFCLSELLGREISGEGAISIVTDVEGRFQIDQKPPGALPQPEPINGLIAAKHDLQISAEGYEDYFANFYVDGSVDGRTGASFLKFRPELEEQDPEFYETFWFWSIVGVAVAGGTTAVLLATVPPKNGPAAFEY